MHDTMFFKRETALNNPRRWYQVPGHRGRYVTVRITGLEALSHRIGDATRTNKPIPRVCRLAGSGTSENLFCGRHGRSQRMGGGASCIRGAGVPLSSTRAVDRRARHRRARDRRALYLVRATVDLAIAVLAAAVRATFVLATRTCFGLHGRHDDFDWVGVGRGGKQ